MAKGKQAVAAANRRLEAAQDHIDRLTEQLTEAKLRARQVEAQASQVPALKKRIAKLEEPDPVVTRIAEWWDTIEKDWLDINKELNRWKSIVADYILVDCQERGLTGVEYVEYLSRRYPDLFRPDGQQDAISKGAPWRRSKVERRLPEEAVRRLQMARGERHADVTDNAGLWLHIEEALAAGFTAGEAMTLLEDERMQETLNKARERIRKVKANA